ncbi:MAG: hypothetical protein ABIJ18_04355 [archaeon]
MKWLYSKRTFLILIIVILLFWVVNDFIPDDSCENNRFGVLDEWHWDVCEDMSPLQNFLYVLFGVITYLGTAYLIFLAIFFLGWKTNIN